MPPKKLPPKAAQAKQPGSNQPPAKPKKAPPPSTEPAIPEAEVKRNSSVSASLALQAAKQAYEYRQAAYGAGDPNAREEILAKAINKEIEAESFGKAAKYTRSGAFQGLAAGAGIGIQPGATLGKVTGALVGGVVSSLGALLGGGIGSAYGAISGPFWDLGQMASQGVRSITGDFPNWEATSSQKKALEKMVLGAQKTEKPSQEELEQMRDDDGGATEADYQQFASDMTSWMPSMPSMPKMPSMPSVSSLPGFGGGSQQKAKQQTTAKAAPQKTQTQPSKPVTRSSASKGEAKPSDTEKPGKAQSGDSGKTSKPADQTAQPRSSTQITTSSETKKRPRKLESRSASTASQSGQPVVKKAPPKLGPRRKPATAAA